MLARFFKALGTGAILGLVSCSTSAKKQTYTGHGAESVDSKTLEEFAPPPVDSVRIRRIQSLLDVRSSSAGILTPDNKNLLVSWNVTGTPQIWKVPGPQQFPIQMTGGEDSSRLLDVTPDGQYLIVSRDEKGNEYPGLYLQPIGGGDLKPIFQKDKVQAFYGFTTEDSQSIYFRANDRNPKSYAFYRYQMGSAQTELVFEGSEGYWVFADQWKKDSLLIAKWKGSASSEYYLLNLKTKELTPLFGQEEDEEYSAVFGPRQDQILVLTNKFSEFRKLYLWSGGQWKPLTQNDNSDISSFKTDRQKTKLAYQVNKEGYSTVQALDLKTLKPTPFMELSDPETLQVDLGEFSQDGRYLTLSLVKAAEPNVGVVYDWSKQRTEVWARASVPEVSLKGMVTPKLEFYPAKDGTKIPMFVQRPPQCETQLCSVIVQFHGGPEAQAVPLFSPIRQIFWERNYIFVEPNVRGSDGYGKTWLHADDGAKRLQVLSDIEDAARYIKLAWAKEGQAPKVAVMGGSYGGYSALMAMTKFAGAYDAGIAVVGMSSLLTFLENTAPYRRILRISEYGDPEKDREALLQLSALTYLDRLKGPMLILHGATDPRVPAGEAIQVYRALQDKNLPGQLVLFPDEGHGIRKRKNQALYFGYILDFLEKSLKSSSRVQGERPLDQ